MSIFGHKHCEKKINDIYPRYWPLSSKLRSYGQAWKFHRGDTRNSPYYKEQAGDPSNSGHQMNNYLHAEEDVRQNPTC